MRRSLATTLICIISLFSNYGYAQWTEPVRISSDPHLGHPRVAVVDDTLHVSAKMLTRLYYLRSFDNGETWTDPICPVDTFYRSYYNDLIYSNGRLHIAFIGRANVQDPLKLYTISSLDNGETWTELREVYDDGWKYPRLAALGDTLFLSCAVERQILVFVSYDNGQTWSEPSVVDSGPLVIDHSPNILYSQGRLHIVYQIGIVGDTVGIEIYHRYSDDHARSWSDRIYLSTPEGVPNHKHSQGPSAHADSSGNIMALWFDYKYGSECGTTGDILGRISRDNGETWLEETRLTYTQTGSASTCVILNGIIYVIWMDYDFLGCGYPKLMYTSSSDWGRSWEELETIFRSDQLYEHQPFLFYNSQDDGNLLHCIMLGDLPDETNDLYYVRKYDITVVSDNPCVVIADDMRLDSYPNPFNSNVTLTLQGSGGGDKILIIYDIRGRLVRELRLEYTGGSQNKAVWDATDCTGQRVASGIYFARILTPQTVQSFRVVYIR